MGLKLESCKIVFHRGFHVQLFNYFCCKRYRLATVYFVRSRQTDEHTTIFNLTAWQYDRLINKNLQRKITCM